MCVCVCGVGGGRLDLKIKRKLEGFLECSNDFCKDARCKFKWTDVKFSTDSPAREMLVLLRPLCILCHFWLPLFMSKGKKWFRASVQIGSPKNNSNVHFLNCNARTQFWRLKGQLRSSYRRPHPNKRNILTIFNETKKKSISRRQLKYFMLLIFFLNIFHIFCSLENIHSIGLTWIASFVLFRWAIWKKRNIFIAQRGEWVNSVKGPQASICPNTHQHSASLCLTPGRSSASMEP